jgi:hypothetical protein
MAEPVARGPSDQLAAKATALFAGGSAIKLGVVVPAVTLVNPSALRLPFGA